MLFNPFDTFFKCLVGSPGDLVTLKQAVHNFHAGFFLVLVDGFDLELKSVYFAVEGLDLSLGVFCPAPQKGILRRLEREGLRDGSMCQGLNDRCHVNALWCPSPYLWGS
jgi:hypothetical protein